MEQIIDVNGYTIEKSEINKITQEIINILSQKNITHAMAYMILENVKQELENTIVKIDAHFYR